MVGEISLPAPMTLFPHESTYSLQISSCMDELTSLTVVQSQLKSFLDLLLNVSLIQDDGFAASFLFLLNATSFSTETIDSSGRN
jgi:hypothetical protein